jgi:hypothetical protein
MTMKRRDLLTFGGGLAAGIMVTPVPWKLLDDVSKWTQNGTWIPRVPRGPVEVKASFCTLCSRGCGMQVRMAAGWPVGISGMPKHPVNRGALCPLAFGAHQLNWHPRRVRETSHRGRRATWNEAAEAFRKACLEGPVLIVDGWRGRAASAIYEDFARRQGGNYRAVLSAEERSLEPVSAWTGVPAAAMGYDVENAGTVVSFGAPLLDGWGAPGRIARLWSEHAAGKTQPDWRLIQVEESLSRTAASAWRWVRILDGAADALACGLARVLLEERLVRTEGPMPPMTLAESAMQTGLSEAAIRELARTVVERAPVLAIAADHSPAVAALNVVLGALGARGGIVRRSRTAAADDGSARTYRAVVIDSTVPWEFRAPQGAEVFRFAAWDGGADRVDWLLPASALFEQATDVPTAPGSTFETYTIAEKLVAPPFETHGAAELLTAVEPKIPDVEATIQKRCGQLYGSKAGTLVSQFASAEDFAKELRRGSVWTGPPAAPGGLECRLREWPAIREKYAAGNWTQAWVPPVLPPLAAKLYRDSSLRPAPNGRQI